MKPRSEHAGVDPPGKPAIEGDAARNVFVFQGLHYAEAQSGFWLLRSVEGSLRLVRRLEAGTRHLLDVQTAYDWPNKLLQQVAAEGR